MIHIDSREPKSMQLLVTAIAGGDVNITKLESADYVLFDRDGHSLGIERKTPSDFLNSLAEKQADGKKRLHSQLARVRSTYDFHVLLFEGPFGYNPETKLIRLARGKKNTGDVRWSHAAVQMALLSLQSRYDVRLVWVPDAQATGDVLRILHQRAQQGCVMPGVESGGVIMTT